MPTSPPIIALIFQRPSFLPLLIVAVALALLGAYAARQRRQHLETLAGLAPATSSWLAPALHCLAALLLVVALARPAWRREPVAVERGGRDVLFLLDVSRSMLAADISPSRLASAKHTILDCLESLEGHRVGLVTFAGSPSIACPLTTDYPFFRKMLAEASPDNVDQGGTRIGDALRKSVDKLLHPDRAGLQDIILISDGGDQESSPAKAAAELDGLGVFLIAIGIGDETEGARVPARSRGNNRNPGFAVHKGREVWSRLDPTSLRTMADACANGAFINAGTSGMDLGSIYSDLVRHLRAAGTNTPETLMRWRDEFPWFLGLALLALATSFLPLRPRTTTRHATAAAALLIALATPQDLPAQNPPEDQPPDPGDTEIPQANQEEPTTPEAAEKFTIPTDPRRAYNMGCRLLAKEKDSAASALFAAATTTATNPDLKARSWYNLGLAQLRQADRIAVPDPAAGLEYYLAASRGFRAALDHQPGWPDAGFNLELARLRAHRTIQMLEQQQQNQDQQEQEDPTQGDPQDGEEGDPAEDSDTEGQFEETDAEGDTTPANQSSSQMAMDLDNQDIPPPVLDPEDIFREESQNNESREKKGGKKYKPVEKDW